MRRWLAVLAGIAAIALTGTALAMTGTVEVAEKAATETTLREREAPPTTEKRAEPRVTVEQPREKDVVWEEPERSVPIEPRDHTAPEIEILHPEDGQVFERKEVALDQETFDRVLAELLDKGTTRRVAEGQARRAAMIAARKKAEG